jgi:hypothetical protein
MVALMDSVLSDRPNNDPVSIVNVCVDDPDPQTLPSAKNRAVVPS